MAFTHGHQDTIDQRPNSLCPWHPCSEAVSRCHCTLEDPSAIIPCLRTRPYVRPASHRPHARESSPCRKRIARPRSSSCCSRASTTTSPANTIRRSTSGRGRCFSTQPRARPRLHRTGPKRAGRTPARVRGTASQRRRGIRSRRVERSAAPAGSGDQPGRTARRSARDPRSPRIGSIRAARQAQTEAARNACSRSPASAGGRGHVAGRVGHARAAAARHRGRRRLWRGRVSIGLANAARTSAGARREPGRAGDKRRSAHSPPRRNGARAGACAGDERPASRRARRARSGQADRPAEARRRPAPRGYSETVDCVRGALAPAAVRQRRCSRTMKCPKCGYLGFKHVERCPNCGYDFSLSSSPAPLDLSIRPSSLNTPQPLADLALVDSGLSLSSPEPKHGSTPEIGSVQVAAAPAPTPELPLFGSPIADDVPLITRPSPPRTPLAVGGRRRRCPGSGADVRTPSLDFVPSDLDAKLSVPTPDAAGQASRPRFRSGASRRRNWRRRPRFRRGSSPRSSMSCCSQSSTSPSCISRCRSSASTFNELTILPKVPLIAFLIVQNLSYFVLFTAGGQTMGQMALGIKVISDEAGASPDLSHAMLRTIVWTVLAVPAGLGLATALVQRGSSRSPRSILRHARRACRRVAIRVRSPDAFRRPGPRDVRGRRLHSVCTRDVRFARRLAALVARSRDVLPFS